MQGLDPVSSGAAPGDPGNDEKRSQSNALVDKSISDGKVAVSEWDRKKGQAAFSLVVKSTDADPTNRRAWAAYGQAVIRIDKKFGAATLLGIDIQEHAKAVLKGLARAGAGASDIDLTDADIKKLKDLAE